MAELNQQQVIDYIKNISVIELSQLVKALETELGVSAAAAMPMAMPMMGGAAAGAAAAPAPPAIIGIAIGIAAAADTPSSVSSALTSCDSSITEMFLM